MVRGLLKVTLVTTAILPVAGCMTSGTNLHGDFACRAPGGTCAPMSTIDARAIAGLGAVTHAAGEFADPAIPSEGRVITASVGGLMPGRTSDRVLRVVFPAHIDPGGIYHEESAVHAVVERGGWTDTLTGGVRRVPSAVATAVTLNSSKADDLQTSKLATLDEIIAARGAMPVQPRAAAVGSVPLPERAGNGPPRPQRSTMAIDLREAAGAASALPVARLDPNFDTPDVAPVIAVAADQTGSCTGSRNIRWHGRANHRPVLRPCPAPASVTVAAQNAAAVNAEGSERSLNLARLGEASQPPATPTFAKANASAAAIMGPPNSAGTATAAAPSHSAPAVAGAAAPVSRFAPTGDAQLAAGRVRAGAAPLIAATASQGRDAARAQNVQPGQMFAPAGAPSLAPSLAPSTPPGSPSGQAPRQ